MPKYYPSLKKLQEKIHSTLDELINSDQTAFEETTNSDDHILDLDHNLSHVAEQNTT